MILDSMFQDVQRMVITVLLAPATFVGVAALIALVIYVGSVIIRGIKL